MKNGSFSALKYCISKLNLLSESYKSLGLTTQTDDSKMTPEQRSKYIDWFTQEDEWEENNPEEALAFYKANGYASGDDITQDDRLARLKRTTTPMVTQKKQWLHDTPRDPAIHKGRKSQGSYHDFILDNDGKLYNRFSTNTSTESGKYRDGSEYSISTDVRDKASNYNLPKEDSFSFDPNFIDVSDRHDGQNVDKFEQEFIPDEDVRAAMSEEDRSNVVHEGMEKMLDLIIDTDDYMRLPDRQELKTIFGIKTTFGGFKNKKKNDEDGDSEDSKPKNRPNDVIYSEFLTKQFGCDSNAFYTFNRHDKKGKPELCYLIGKSTKTGAWYCATFVNVNSGKNAAPDERRLYFFNAPVADTIYNLGAEAKLKKDPEEIENIKNTIEKAISVETLVVTFVKDFLRERQTVGARENNILKDLAKEVTSSDIILKLGEATIDSRVDKNKKIDAVTLFRVRKKIGRYFMIAEEPDGSYRVISKSCRGDLDNPVIKIIDLCVIAITDTLANDPGATKDQLIEAVTNEIAYSYSRADISSLVEKVAAKNHANRAKQATKGDGAMYNPFAKLDDYLDPDSLPQWNDGDPLATDEDHAIATTNLRNEVDKDVADTLAGLKPIADLGDGGDVSFDESDINRLIASSEANRKPDKVSANDAKSSTYAQKGLVFTSKVKLAKIIRNLPGFLGLVKIIEENKPIQNLVSNFNPDKDKSQEYNNLPANIKEDIGMIYLFLMLAMGHISKGLIDKCPEIAELRLPQKFFLHKDPDKRGKTASRPVSFSSFVKSIKSEYPEIDKLARVYKTKKETLEDDKEAGYKKFYDAVTNGDIEASTIKHFYPSIANSIAERGDESVDSILDKFFKRFKTRYSYNVGDKKQETPYNVTIEVNNAVEIIYSLILGSISELINSKREREVTIIQVDNIIRRGTISADKLGRGQKDSDTIITRGENSQKIKDESAPKEKKKKKKAGSTDIQSGNYADVEASRKKTYTEEEYNQAVEKYNDLIDDLDNASDEDGVDYGYSTIINLAEKIAEKRNDEASFTHRLRTYCDGKETFVDRPIQGITMMDNKEILSRLMLYFDILGNRVDVPFEQRFTFIREIKREYANKRLAVGLRPKFREIVKLLTIIDSYERFTQA